MGWALPCRSSLRGKVNTEKSISATYFEWLRLIRISLHKNWRCDNILLKTTIDELTDDANWESSEADEFSLDWYV